MNSYYVYAFLRKDGSPYYVGKGKGNRMYNDRGRPVKKPKNNENIILLENEIDEITAFEKEKYYISLYGRKDNGTGILRNKTDGGEGASGVIHSDEYKKNMSNIIKNLFDSGKRIGYWKYNKQTEEHRRKNSIANSGKNNPMFGKKHGNTSKELISKKKEVYEYEIIHLKTGNIFHTRSLRKFCKNHELSKTGLGNTYLGKSKLGKTYSQHKGYKIIKKVKINEVN